MDAVTFLLTFPHEDIMIEFILGYAITLPFLVILLFAGILFEHNESRGLAIVSGIVATVVAYFYFKFPIVYALYGTGVYAVVGVVWSFYRYKRYVVKQVEKTRNPGMTASQKQTLIERMHPTAMLGTITAWILIWPFSVLDNLIGDIINSVEHLVKTVFRGVYHKIYTSAVSQIK